MKISGFVLTLSTLFIVGCSSDLISEGCSCDSPSYDTDECGDLSSICAAPESTKYLSSFTASDLELQNAESCTSLNETLRAQAKSQLNAYWEDSDNCGMLSDSVDISVQGDASEDSASASTESSSSSDVSYTAQNSQVQGIVEPDTVINNDEIIAVLSNSEIKIYKAWPVSEAGLLSTIGYTDGRWTYSFRKFFLKDNVLHVFGTARYNGTTSATRQNYAAWFRYDVSDPGNPLGTEATLLKNGSWVDARLKDSDEIVAVFQKSFSVDFDYGPETDLSWDEMCSDDGEMTEAYATAVATHIESESAEIDTWSIEDGDLPQFSTLNLDNLSIMDDFDVGCGDIKTNAYVNGNYVTVMLTETTASAAILAQAAMTNYSTLYMNHDALILASIINATDYDVLNADQVTIGATVLHLFDWQAVLTTTTESLAYTASGIVPGTVDGQWAFDELDGTVRVATTVWEEDAASAMDVVLTVLQTDDDFLKITGQVTDLVSGEEIFATRYVGDTAYIVTFLTSLTWDPLFVIDTSEASVPVLLGSLEMPGFSSYLQLVDDGILLGVGVADPSCWGSYCYGSELKASLYDVSDGALPVEADVETVATDWTSNADITHLTVHYDSEREQLFVPYEDTGMSEINFLTTPEEEEESSSGVQVLQRTGSNLSVVEDIAVDPNAVGSIMRTLIYSDDDSCALIVVGSDGIEVHEETCAP